MWCHCHFHVFFLISPPLKFLFLFDKTGMNSPILYVAKKKKKICGCVDVRMYFFKVSYILKTKSTHLNAVAVTRGSNRCINKQFSAFIESIKWLPSQKLAALRFSTNKGIYILPFWSLDFSSDFIQGSLHNRQAS